MNYSVTAVTNDTDIRYMRRAIELARHGRHGASPNPMVGAVIVAGDRIIGEGYHRKCGQGHAEVNAMASVADADRHLLPEATVYVTLEPCSHYGKTPPCAKLLIDNKVKRVVVGSPDPFPQVSGRGVAMLRQAGIEVVTGVLEHECRAINPAFLTAHTLGRPYVTLKWAQSSDGYVAGEGGYPVKLSSPLGFALSHRLRTLHDAILVGSGTVKADNPSLTPRLWPGRTPLRAVADRSGSCPAGAALLTDGGTTAVLGMECGGTPEGYLRALGERGVTSVLVEGGPRLHKAFLDSGLWDAVRIEQSPVSLHGGVKAPEPPGVLPLTEGAGANTIFTYLRPGAPGVVK